MLDGIPDEEALMEGEEEELDVFTAMTTGLPLQPPHRRVSEKKIERSTSSYAGSKRGVIMNTPFGKSVSAVEKAQKLRAVAGAGDSLAILVNADPDALACALALKRLFWRKVKPVHIFRINRIDRADNLAFVRLLDIRHRHIRALKKSEFNKWALVDSQPSHDEHFAGINFDIIIDHHPRTTDLNAEFIDIKEDYGANATLMTEYLRAAKIKPSPRIATALFYAIKTDTDNFVRPTVDRDMIAFRYLYDYANLNIIKKIESSEITRQTLSQFKKAIQELTFVNHMAVAHMGVVNKPDTIVQVADFFLKLAEAAWSISSGVYNDRLIVVFRNAGFRRNAGKMARDLFGDVGSAGGHRDSARAEIPLKNINCLPGRDEDCRQYVMNRIRTAPHPAN
jgi:nanoRNase/pAp phosphatase (c-di-AMP/oligoRNAs hydrolase)